MSEPDKFEEDLLYALTRTGEGFRTEEAGLVVGGYRRGRGRWRRRSTAAVVGGAAALALVGTGAVYLAGAPAGRGAVAASVPLTPAGTGTGPAARASAGSAPASASVVTGDEVLAAFRALLPQGETREAVGRGTDDPALKGSFAGADLVFDDGHGPAAVSISIQKHRKGQTQARTCPDPKLNRIDSCTVTTLADGSSLYLSQGYEYPDHRADTKEWMAVLTGPDGREILVDEWSAPREKGAPDSRPNPPLTPEQLKAIVTDRSWDRIVAAVQYDGVDHASADPGLSLDDRRAILARLLPAGVTVTGIEGNEVTADVRLAGGGTAGSLFLRVQKLSGAARDKTQQTAGGATVLPDGARLRLYGPGTATVEAQPMAELLRGDLQVTVGQGPTGKPLLTLEQLSAIATSPEWQAKK